MRITLFAVWLFPLSLIAGLQQPRSAEVVAFAANPVQASSDLHFKNFQVGQVEFSKILDSYVSVSGEQWIDQYSHMSGGDRTGTVTLRDGTILKWLAKPGGLATITYPDGTILYLVASTTF